MNPVNISERLSQISDLGKLDDFVKELQVKEGKIGGGRFYTTKDTKGHIHLNDIVNKLIELNKTQNNIAATDDILGRIILLSNKDHDLSVLTTIRQLVGNTLFSVSHLKSRDTVINEMVDQLGTNANKALALQDLYEMKEGMINQGVKFHTFHPHLNHIAGDLIPDLNNYIDSIAEIYLGSPSLYEQSVAAMDPKTYQHLDTTSLITPLVSFLATHENDPDARELVTTLIAHILINKNTNDADKFIKDAEELIKTIKPKIDNLTKFKETKERMEAKEKEEKEIENK